MRSLVRVWFTHSNPRSSWWGGRGIRHGQSVCWVLGASLTLALGCLPRDEELGRDSLAQKADAKPKPKPKDSETSRKSQSSKGKDEGEPKPTAAKPAGPDPVIAAVFEDDFNRSVLGDEWRTTSKSWAVRGGRLCGARARNHPVWLARRIPVDARIEFDAMSSSQEGDIKAEFWGDGRSAASGISYDDATSYLAILGGWKNRFHVLARINEHAKDRNQLIIDPESDDPRYRKVEPNRSYRFKVERHDGQTVRWLVDDIELFNFTDPDPLTGEGHEHFGFNNWEVQVCFDNLRITKL